MIKESELIVKFIKLLKETNKHCNELSTQIWELDPNKMNINQWKRKHDNLEKRLKRWDKISKTLTPIIMDLIDYKPLKE